MKNQKKHAGPKRKGDASPTEREKGGGGGKKEYQRWRWGNKNRVRKKKKQKNKGFPAVGWGDRGGEKGGTVTSKVKRTKKEKA